MPDLRSPTFRTEPKPFSAAQNALTVQGVFMRGRRW
ncbi:hypothetical protein PSPPH_2624 [Pseudomonas savastanoi pv. phaseolicola 1448A]|uniref:Uncharacterized protein n=3 Tax=Pseudomonas savastanoi TaxID=29438 RepID=A0A3M6EDQ8_PSESG|nr:hypothetical protein PSPPH_2624 [Pseudomonas savastanoi pv. phaseolicola 1448A]KPY10288.1 Uncharacterized protein ALO55_04650 [Pseudomonas savastanoi pv. phaseolicola]RML90764.1 hypothetical protein ALQ87_04433 [Pseudomonas savastanoi pv. glycinea]RMM67169.1 hypothetical protein ALQ74_04362 [Pseudomonas savastanoi pv. glycinea]RMM68554.1 hypothetical protein ALQ73_102433 [Pseudomonas savastanoi pv. glycinea]